MSYLDETLAGIITRRSRGLDTKTISLELGLSAESIESQERYFRSHFKKLLLYKGGKGITSETLDQMPEQNRAALFSYYHLIPSGAREKKPRKADLFREAVSQGYSALQILSNINTSPSMAYNLSREEGIKLPSEKVSTRTEIKVLRHRLKQVETPKTREINKRIRRGQPLEQIGGAFGVCRENIRHHIVGSGQHDYWRMSRQFYEYTQEERTLDEVHPQIINLLRTYVDQRVESIDNKKQWAEKQALRYKTSLKTHERPQDIPLQNIIKLFEVYQKAEQSGRKVSLEEMGCKSGIGTMQVRNILLRVGLNSFFWRSEYRPRLTPKQRGAIENLAMNSRDISFFSGYSQSTISKINSIYSSHILADFGSTRRLSYRIASQVYESQDAGFTEPEICELLGKDIKVVQHAIQHRPKIEKTIKKALRIFHPDKKVDKPYL